MARGGFRNGAGRPKGSKGSSIPSALWREARGFGETPLEYMWRVMSDPEADPTRRDRMAIAAAPFVHARVADNRVGKGDRKRARAKEVATGRFKPPAQPPKLN
jgi:hypothetical protein